MQSFGGPNDCARKWALTIGKTGLYLTFYFGKQMILYRAYRPSLPCGRPFLNQFNNTLLTTRYYFCARDLQLHTLLQPRCGILQLTNQLLHLFTSACGDFYKPYVEPSFAFRILIFTHSLHLLSLLRTGILFSITSA